MAATQSFMRRALDLGEQGLGRTDPNPAVGAVLVRGGEIVGQGFHRQAGGPHAEIEALRDAGELARGAIAYVTLEPCCTHGRTPPCTDALIKAGISKVYFGCLDPNRQVSGRGVQALREAGVEAELVVDTAEQVAAQHLISGFACLQTFGRPEVIVKAAMSLDGQLAPAGGVSRWITGPESRVRAHWFRDTCDAVLVGSGTVLQDDPSLTVRDPPSRDGRQPLRVLVDGGGCVSPTARMLGSGSLVAVGTSADAAWMAQVEATGAEVWRASGDRRVALEELLAYLGARGLTRVLVEGGSRLHGALLAAGLADRAALFLAPMILGGGGFGLAEGWLARHLRDRIDLIDTHIERLGPDILVRGTWRYPDSEES